MEGGGTPFSARLQPSSLDMLWKGKRRVALAHPSPLVRRDMVGLRKKRKTTFQEPCMIWERAKRIAMVVWTSKDRASEA